MEVFEKLKRLAGRTKGSIDPQWREIERSGLFDRAYYLARYPDIAASGIDPLLHFIEHGALECRNPSEFFDTAYYLDQNPDVAQSGANPLLHFGRFGWKEARNPGMAFDIAHYAEQHLGGAMAVNPLVHYLASGRADGLEVRAVKEHDRAVIEASGLFDEEYYLRRYPDVAGGGFEPLGHFLKHGAAEMRNPCELFDTAYYRRHNPEVARTQVNPLLDFCLRGWKELRNPSLDFDVWWYWSNHLDPADDSVNPLAHYHAIGKALGLETRPSLPVGQAAGSGLRYPPDYVPRRICLFAGYDADGLIDEYVIDYLRELGQYADIYYLADCEMQPGELDKIAPYVEQAWAERHGGYDFGSYAMLARDKVGWRTIHEYDELIFANDSCYLLRELHHVFSKMDRKACDWWGMQATKGIAATAMRPENRFLQPIPMSAVRSSLLDTYETGYEYDFLVGSYFAVYRRPVIEDAGFRHRVDTVIAQPSKKMTILKYEVGFTRYLIVRHFALETFIDDLYPFHPIYSNWYFRLLEEGFPFLKRYFLSENHYRVPRLADWMERIGRRLPNANIDTIQRNLARVVDPEKLRANLNIGTERALVDHPMPGELLTDEEFLAADQTSPKYRHWWAFPVCAFTGVFSGNERALFEEVKNDPSIHKVVLTLDKPVAVDGADVDIVPLESARGQHLLMRCGNIFIKHSPKRNLLYPIAFDLHNIINLWHGIPFKRIGYASLDMQHRRQAIAHEHAQCRAVICSSKVDALAMTASFFPLTYRDVWLTGLPRNDFILRDFDRLPADLRAEGARLYDMVADRRLVLFMPTFRNAQEDAYYRFSAEEIGWLEEWLVRNNAVLGVREHMADSARTFTQALQGVDTIALDHGDFPNPEILYRHSAALITDYSSCFIDYMLTGKPAVSFAYDHERYAAIERGAFYDLDDVFPGPVCRTFTQFKAALQNLFNQPSPEDEMALKWKRRMFFDYVDDRNSARVVAKVAQLTDCGGVGKEDLEIRV